MKLAKITALLALAAALGTLARFSWLAGDAARELPLRADQAVAREADATRLVLAKLVALALLTAQVEIGATRRDMDARLASVERQVISEVRLARTDALARLDSRLASMEGIAAVRLREALVVADNQLTVANLTLATEAARLNTSVAKVADVAPPLQATMERIADASPLWLDCQFNADCLFNRWVGTSRGVEKMALAFGANAGPQQAALTAIAEDVRTVTHEFTRKKTWKEKLWSGLKVAGGVAVLAVK